MFLHADLFNGDLSKWDVSSVKDMFEMFWHASSFNGEISNWDVSRVTRMSKMFWHASSFNGDLSTWDVSSVKDMTSMFQRATSFNGDLSNWNVSSVTEMDYMFQNARSLKQKLCGAAWVNSKASKVGMFEGSPGSISTTVCATTPAFSPQSNAELKSAINASLDRRASPCVSEHKRKSGFGSVGVVFDLDGVIYHNSPAGIVATPGYSLRTCMSGQMALA